VEASPLYEDSRPLNSMIEKREERGLEMKPSVSALVFVLALSAAYSGAAGETVNCKVRATFSSQGSIAEVVLRELRQARSKLVLAVYGFSNRLLAEELAKLAGRGVTVRVKIDDEKSRERREGRVIEVLKAAGVSVQAVAPEGRNHNKFAVIDDSRVITGSYNWTLKAEKNWENLLILDCPVLARMYVKEWETIQ